VLLLLPNELLEAAEARRLLLLLLCHAAVAGVDWQEAAREGWVEPDGGPAAADDERLEEAGRDVLLCDDSVRLDDWLALALLALLVPALDGQGKTSKSNYLDRKQLHTMLSQECISGNIFCLLHLKKEPYQCKGYVKACGSACTDTCSSCRVLCAAHLLLSWEAAVRPPFQP